MSPTLRLPLWSWKILKIIKPGRTKKGWKYQISNLIRFIKVDESLWCVADHQHKNYSWGKKFQFLKGIQTFVNFFCCLHIDTISALDLYILIYLIAGQSSQNLCNHNCRSQQDTLISNKHITGNVIWKDLIWCSDGVDKNPFA